jgi:putative transposase
VLTARKELTGQMLIVSQRHLHTILIQYAAHSNGRRPHRSRQLRPSPITLPPTSPRSGSGADPCWVA